MPQRLARRAITFIAVALPMLLAFNEPPSPTLLNQGICLGLIGVWVVTIAAHGQPRPRDIWSLLLAMGTALACLAGSLARGLPPTLASGLAAVVLAAAVATCAGNAAARGVNAHDAFVDLAWALCGAGMVSSLIGCVQVFAPDWPDGELIARSALSGRAVGNLRQPNHLASLTLWALVAVAALSESKASRWVLLAGGLCLFGVVLSGSRTGTLGVILLALWGLLDRRLSRETRSVLVATPLAYGVLWLVVALWAHSTANAFSGEDHLLAKGGGDISSSRFGIWSNALAMIRHEPLTGVGFGEFNLAWTLSEFPNRPTAFFDHTHNLPLQVLVEFGIPLGLLAIGALLMALMRAGHLAWATVGDTGTAKRAMFMLVLMIGMHSLLEYPLWYAYFLLPTAFAWGFALARPDRGDGAVVALRDGQGSRGMHPALAMAGLAMSIGAAAAMLDYRSVVVIYDPPDNASPLEDHIARGQRSPLFGHHADYAAATAFGEPKAPLSPSQELAFKRAPHQLLDFRLMIAWSQALAAQGELDKARWLAARIREFRNPGSDEYFAPCSDAALAPQAFQCQPPTRVVNWREFVHR